jgi:hypothetical protein
MTLKRDVISRTDAKVQVVYVGRDTARLWNTRRKADDTPTFCGWYWFRGHDEAGPFRTMSAAYRDAYYRFVLERETPGIGRRLAMQQPPRK